MSTLLPRRAGHRRLRSAAARSMTRRASGLPRALIGGGAGHARRGYRVAGWEACAGTSPQFGVVPRTMASRPIVGALGGVFGDIGTSPRYALHTVLLIDNDAIEPTRSPLLGVAIVIAVTTTWQRDRRIIIGRADASRRMGRVAECSSSQLRLICSGAGWLITRSRPAGGKLLPVRWSIERTAGILLVVALVLAGAGINSGTSLNTEAVRMPAGMMVVGCGSPWAPDYVQAEQVDLSAFPQMHSVAHACRNHNDAEALVADAAAPGGLLIALAMLGVLVFGARPRQAQRPRSPDS